MLAKIEQTVLTLRSTSNDNNLQQFMRSGFSTYYLILFAYSLLLLHSLVPHQHAFNSSNTAHTSVQCSATPAWHWLSQFVEIDLGQHHLESAEPTQHTTQTQIVVAQAIPAHIELYRAAVRPYLPVFSYTDKVNFLSNLHLSSSPISTHGLRAPPALG